MRTVRAAIGLALMVASVPALATPNNVARSCARHGPGFVEVPGTTTCMRLSGRIAAEAGTSRRRVSRDDVVGLGASGRVSLDARSETEYGPVRTYVRVKAGSAGHR